MIRLAASQTESGRSSFGFSESGRALVTVNAPPAVITLSASGYRVRGLQKADLTWSGATSANVDIYRDGAVLLTSANDGFETDDINVRGSGSYTYQVCEAGTTTCSEVVTVTF